MTGDPPLPGGDLEYAVLRALWEGGRLSARQIHERTGAPQGLALTTTTRVLDRLQAKGLVERARGHEGTFSYHTPIRRPDVDGARLRRLLVAMMEPTPRPALAALVEAVESIDPSLLELLASVVEARRRSRGEP